MKNTVIFGAAMFLTGANFFYAFDQWLRFSLHTQNQMPVEATISLVVVSMIASSVYMQIRKEKK